MKEEISKKYSKSIYINIIKAIIIMLYFIALINIYQMLDTEYFERIIKTTTMITLIISISIFEKAYKKDNDSLALHGIEIIVLSVYTLTAEYITKKYNFSFKNYLMVASYISGIYIILKCIFIYTKCKRQEVNSRSDVREIVKKTEPIKKEATKRNSANSISSNKKKKEEEKNND